MMTNSTDQNPLDQRPYFFDQGIRFTCQQCGVCCTGDPGTIYISHGEIDALARHLALSRDDLIQRYLYPFKDSYSIGEDDDGRCLFYDGGCTIYLQRPRQCRTFPFWFDNMRSKDRWQKIASQCPGIGSGRLYGREEILVILETTHSF